MTADNDKELRSRGEFITALTTQHFTLQGARGGTISESASRSSLYMTTLSSAVVALALVAQVSRGGILLPVFALAILPVVFFLGLVTYGRLLQCGAEDFYHARAMSRIRRFYGDLEPANAQLFNETSVDQVGLQTAGIFPPSWQLFLPASAMVAIVNSVVGGAFLAAVGAWIWAPPAWAATLVGIAATAVIATLLLTHLRRVMDRVKRIDPPVAPSASAAS